MRDYQTSNVTPNPHYAESPYNIMQSNNKTNRASTSTGIATDRVMPLSRNGATASSNSFNQYLNSASAGFGVMETGKSSKKAG